MFPFPLVYGALHQLNSSSPALELQEDEVWDFQSPKNRILQPTTYKFAYAYTVPTCNSSYCADLYLGQNSYPPPFQMDPMSGV